MRAPLCEDLDSLDADIAFLGAPFDESSPIFPGMRYAPRRAREMSLKFAPRGTPKRGLFNPETETVILEREIVGNRIADCGDVDVLYTRMDLSAEKLKSAVSKIISKRAFPIVFGGDDSVALPVVQAFSASTAFAEQPLDIVAIDAHLDFTNNMLGITHSGMNQFRRISELPNVERIYHVGIRGIRSSKTVFREALDRGNTIVTASQIKKKGVEEAFAPLFQGTKRNVYVNLDIDGLDPTIAPGCSGTEPGGLLYHEISRILEIVASRTRVVGFGVNEINPLIDVNNITSQLAVQLTLELLGALTQTEAWAAHRSAP
jgi:agmatinase